MHALGTGSDQGLRPPEPLADGPRHRSPAWPRRARPVATALVAFRILESRIWNSNSSGRFQGKLALWTIVKIRRPSLAPSTDGYEQSAFVAERTHPSELRQPSFHVPVVAGGLEQRAGVVREHRARIRT